MSIAAEPAQRGRRAARVGPWVLIGGFAAGTLASVVFDREAILTLGYPLAASGVGAVLFRLRPELYVGFTWWLWLLTPLVRRLVDYHVGWNPTNPILLAPLLVTSLSALSLLRHLPKLKRKTVMPFGLVLAGILSAYPLGVIRAGPTAATYGFLQWVAPVCFGFHLAIHWDRYPAYRRTTQRVFVVGVLLLGLYGIWQYLSPQPWDTYWMVSSHMESIGWPEPRLVRVFSTMNSPTPFAMLMLAGLLTLFGTRAAIQWLAGVPAYAAFLLSLVRTAWLGWLVAVLTYGAYVSRRERLRVLAVAGGLGVMMLPLIGSARLQGVISTRLESFRGLSEDVSFQERLAFYSGTLGTIVAAPLGQGHGATGAATLLSDAGQGQRYFDSGILDVLRTLGWLGGAELFLGGALAIVFQLIHRGKPTNDNFAHAGRAISIAVFACMLSLNTMAGLVGVLFWGFVGLVLAARRYAEAAGEPGGAEGQRSGHVSFSRSGHA